MGVLFGVGIFMFQMTFSSVGCCGGPEMFYGPEMVKLLCGYSAAYVDGLKVVILKCFVALKWFWVNYCVAVVLHM